MQVRLDGRKVIRLQCGQQPIGAVIELRSWSNCVDVRFHTSS